MDFTLTDGQKKLVSAFRTFGADTFTPERVAKWCRDQGLPDTVMKEFVDLYYETAEPDIAPDLAHSLLSQVLIVEELSRCAGTPLPFQNDLFNLQIMSGFAGAAEAASIAEDYRADGRLMFALAISEPEAGSANQYMTTTATKKDGKIHINGTKTWVTSGENSDGFIVVCKNEDPSPENKQMSMYLVPANAKGVTIEPLNKIGMQIMPFSKVIFDDVVVDESALLGIEGKGFLQLMKNFEWERCVLLAELLGEAQAAMDDACAWTNERQQFGVGIKTFQLVQEHIVEMQIALTNTRNFLYRTCWKLDNGIPVNNDAAMLKRYGAPALTDVCSRALQLMGGLGYTDATRVSRLMLDCRGFQIGGGTVEIMVHIAGRGILKEYAKGNQDEL